MRNLILFAFVSVAAACTPYDPDLGPAPFICGPVDQTPRCPEGYTCQTTSSGDYCLAPMGTVPVDGNNSMCADDSQLEPNDSYMQAFQTPVATTKMTLTFAGLAICPAGDKDTYSVTITTMGQNLEVITEYDAGGAQLNGSILNAGGTPIANASPVTGEAGKLRAYVANLPVGTFYAQVYGPNMGGLQTNNYKLTITVTGP